MNQDWREKIVELARWKEAIADLDTLHVFPWHLPRTRASREQILNAEAVVGSLPDDYKYFLTYANGWPGFFHAIDLFGTPELTNLTSQAYLQREDISESLMQAVIDISSAVVIGASRLDLDVFIYSPSSSLILWVAGQEIERYSTFDALFDAMIVYNARTARKLAGESVQ